MREAGPRSVQGRSLSAGLIRDRIDPVEGSSDALERQVELIVRRVQIVDDRLQRGLGLDPVADGQEEAMRDIDENRHFVHVVPDLDWFHGSIPSRAVWLPLYGVERRRG